MSETYQYSQRTQKAIVAMLLYDKVNFAFNRSVIRSEYFENEICGAIVKLIQDFYDGYERAPTKDELFETLLQYLAANRKIPADMYTSCLEEIERIGEKSTTPGAGGFDFAKDKVIEFARAQGVKNALVESAALYKSGDFDAIRQKIIAACDLNIGAGPLDTVVLSDVEPKKVTWLWDNKIPKGKLSLIIGNPNVGKSYFSLMLAASLSRGARFNEREYHPCDKGKVIILSAEDGIEVTCPSALCQP